MASNRSNIVRGMLLPFKAPQGVRAAYRGLRKEIDELFEEAGISTLYYGHTYGQPNQFFVRYWMPGHIPKYDHDRDYVGYVKYDGSEKGMDQAIKRIERKTGARAIITSDLP